MKNPTPEQEAANPAIKNMLEDLDVIASVSRIAESKGGLVLINGLVKDVVGAIDTLASKHMTLTLQEFIGICAEIKTKLDLVRALKRAPKNRKTLQEMIEETLMQ